MFKNRKFKLAVCAIFFFQIGIVTNVMAHPDYGCPSGQEAQMAIDMALREKHHVIKIPTYFGVLQSEPVQLNPKLLERVELDHTIILYNSKSGSANRIEVICAYRSALGLNIKFYAILINIFCICTSAQPAFGQSPITTTILTPFVPIQIESTVYLSTSP